MKFASYVVDLTTTDQDADLLTIGSIAHILRDRFDGTAIHLERVEMRRDNSDNPFWTIAYRNPSDKYFHRVTDYKGTWQEASDKAGQFGQDHPNMEIWTTTTREAEMAGYCGKEDIGVILLGNGQYVHMVDDGTINYK